MQSLPFKCEISKIEHVKLTLKPNKVHTDKLQWQSGDKESFLYWLVLIYLFLFEINSSLSVCQWFSRPGFNPRLSHTRLKKWLCDASLLNTQHYKVWIKGKWSNPGKELVSSITLWWGSYLKGSLQVTLNCSWPIYLTLFICVCVCESVCTQLYIYTYKYMQK